MALTSEGFYSIMEESEKPTISVYSEQYGVHSVFMKLDPPVTQDIYARVHFSRRFMDIYRHIQTVLREEVDDL